MIDSIIPKSNPVPQGIFCLGVMFVQLDLSCRRRRRWRWAVPLVLAALLLALPQLAALRPAALARVDRVVGRHYMTRLDALQQENFTLHQQLAQSADALAENAALRQLVGCGRGITGVTPARVVGGGAGRFTLAYPEATPGPAVEYDFVARDIAEMTAGMQIEQIAFDRYRMGTLQKELDRAGVVLPFVPFGQGYVSMAPAIDATEIEFLHKRVRHAGHPVLTMCAATAVMVSDPAGNRKLDKSKSTGRIDGMVALAMAMGAAKAGEVEMVSVSPWDDPNFSLVEA